MLGHTHNPLGPISRGLFLSLQLCLIISIGTNDLWGLAVSNQLGDDLQKAYQYKANNLLSPYESDELSLTSDEASQTSSFEDDTLNLVKNKNTQSQFEANGPRSLTQVSQLGFEDPNWDIVSTLSSFDDSTEYSLTTPAEIETKSSELEELSVTPEPIAQSVPTEPAPVNVRTAKRKQALPATPQASAAKALRQDAGVRRPVTVSHLKLLTSSGYSNPETGIVMAAVRQTYNPQTDRMEIDATQSQVQERLLQRNTGHPDDQLAMEATLKGVVAIQPPLNHLRSTLETAAEKEPPQVNMPEIIDTVAQTQRVLSDPGSGATDIVIAEGLRVAAMYQDGDVSRPNRISLDHRTLPIQENDRDMHFHKTIFSSYSLFYEQLRQSGKYQDSEGNPDPHLLWVSMIAFDYASQGLVYKHYLEKMLGNDRANSLWEGLRAKKLIENVDGNPLVARISSQTEQLSEADLLDLSIDLNVSEELLKNIFNPAGGLSFLLDSVGALTDQGVLMEANPNTGELFQFTEIIGAVQARDKELFDQLVVNHEAIVASA